MKVKTLFLIQAICACVSFILFGISVWEAFWGTWWIGLITFVMSGIVWLGYVRGIQSLIREEMGELKRKDSRWRKPPKKKKMNL